MQIAMNQQRHRLAPAERRMNTTEFTRALQLRSQVITVKAYGAEADVEKAAISRRRAGRVGMAEVMPLMRHPLRRQAFPELFPAGPLEAEDEKTIIAVRRLRLSLE